MTQRLKIIISAIAVILILLHQFVPAVKIGTFTGIVIVIAILPWILHYLKGFEIPGVLKIHLADPIPRMVLGYIRQYQIRQTLLLVDASQCE